MLKDKKIIIWVSWWPDSMFLAFLLANFLWKENLIIAHFNHKFRKESDYEEKKLKEIFKDYTFVSWSYSWNNFSENILRKYRYDFFKEVWWGKYYLALWHNLTDRIETSFLSLARWWGLKGFLNMKKLDKNKKIIRPLLDIPKSEITQKCDLFWIPYFIDKTNLNDKISKRNFIRNHILPLFEKINYQFYYSFRNLYYQIEWLLPDLDIWNYLIKLDDNFYLLKGFSKKNLKSFLREILDYFWEIDFRSRFLDELESYILYSKWWWYKKIWRIFFLKKKWKIFIWVWENVDIFKFLTKKYC